ncbi:AAA family ATPase [Nonomuraea sp. NPDC050451]|uniref:AAA family ATPase n=1 Tax=Nonomuraea sp. NPDC050451 TaxID=3364364 RepID=UPI0037B25B5E
MAMLIGRERPAAVLRGEVSRALVSHGALVLVTGEAGIGKSALVAGAAEEAVRGGARLLGGACWEGEGAPGYWPWVQVVRRLAPGASLQSPFPGLAGSDGFELYDAVTGLLVDASRERPVVVVLEDLHWADAASLRLLEFVVSHAWFERLLVIGTYRDAEVDGPLSLPLEAKATILTLTGLDREEVGRLVAHTTGVDPGEELVTEIHRRTGGNPFFVEQTARLWQGGTPLATIPPGVGAAVRRRLSRLPEGVLEVLRMAAVLGREFTEPTLHTALTPPPTTSPLDTATPNDASPDHACLSTSPPTASPFSGYPPPASPLNTSPPNDASPNGTRLDGFPRTASPLNTSAPDGTSSDRACLDGSLPDDFSPGEPPPDRPTPNGSSPDTPAPDEPSADWTAPDGSSPEPPPNSPAPHEPAPAGPAPAGAVPDGSPPDRPLPNRGSRSSPPRGATPTGQTLVATEASVRRALDQAVSAKLITSLGSGRHAFIHDLVRETLYAELNDDEVRARHAAALRALDPALPAIRAHHAYLAAAPDAPDLLLTAARDAEARMADEEAVGHYRRALALTPAWESRKRATIGLDLGVAQHRVGDTATGARTLEAAVAITRRLDDPDLLALTALKLHDLGHTGQGRWTDFVHETHHRLVPPPTPTADAPAGPVQGETAHKRPKAQSAPDHDRPSPTSAEGPAPNHTTTTHRRDDTAPAYPDIPHESDDTARASGITRHRHTTQDHTTQDHTTQDHATQDHATQDHATRRQSGDTTGERNTTSSRDITGNRRGGIARTPTDVSHEAGDTARPHSTAQDHNPLHEPNAPHEVDYLRGNDHRREGGHLHPVDHLRGNDALHRGDTTPDTAGYSRGRLDVAARELSEVAAELARQGQDDETLGFSLLSRLGTIWGPGTAAERLAVTEELSAVARRSLDPRLELTARSWRVGALLEMGDPRCLTEHQTFVTRAEGAELALFQHEATVLRAMFATLTGRFDEAGTHIDAAYEQGEQPGIGRRDLRWMQRWSVATLSGRFDVADGVLAEMELAGSHHFPLYRAATAVQRGDEGAARHLAEVTAAGEQYLRWMAPLRLRLQAQAAALSKDPVLCEHARAAITPYVGQWGVTATVAVEGSFAHWAAVLDAAQGRWDEAVDGFTAAYRAADLLGARPWSIESRARLAEALQARGDDASALIAQVERDADALGMLVRLPRPAANAFRLDGGVWTLSFAGRTVHLPDSKGLADLRVLLDRPGSDVSTVELLNPAGGEVVLAARSMGGDDVLDEEARTRYRRRLELLDDEIDRAAELGDDRRAAELDAERTALLNELRTAAGLGGRPRRLGDEAERARKAVTNRIRNTLRQLDQRHPELAAHLRSSVSTGATCRYHPSPEVRWSP